MYSDTDSIKIRNADSHKAYFDEYNKNIECKLIQAMQAQNIPIERVKPKTTKGVEKLIGVWDFDGHYSRFKSLGAKRYMTEHDGEINITVAGLNKKVCVPYLVRTFGKNVFEHFNEQLYVPADYTGKMTHTYIDFEISGIMVDYLGNKSKYKEFSAIHLAGSDYDLSIAEDYAKYIRLATENYNKENLNNENRRTN